MAAPPTLTPYQESVIDQNLGPTVVAVSGFFIALTTTAVALRFATKFKKAGFGADDYLAVGALVFVILFCVTCIISVPYGMGKHDWAVNPLRVWKIIQVGLYNALLYTIVHWFIKMSILMFYRRLFGTRTTWFNITFWVMVSYVTVWFIGVFFAALFQCFPPAFFYEQYNPALKPPPKGSCGVSNTPLVISSSALNSVADVILFGIPLVMLSSLNMTTQNRWPAMFIFATGAIAVAAGFVRLSKTLEAVKPTADVTWVTAQIYMWTAVEAGVGLTCACLPSLGHLYKAIAAPVTSFFSRLTSRGSASRLNEQGNGSERIKGNGGIELVGQKGNGILKTDEISIGSTRRPAASVEEQI